jgi:hypothetical protein
MKSRAFWTWIASQVVGAYWLLSASHVDTMSWILGAVFLLPGSLLDLVIFKQGGVGNAWPKWTVAAIPIVVNALLFFSVVYRRGRGAKAA